MTMPVEEIRSLLFARSLLRDIAQDAVAPQEYRRQAAVVLRHYPTGFAIRNLARRYIREGLMSKEDLEELMHELDAYA